MIFSKTLASALVELFTVLFNKIIETKEIPKEWEILEIIALFKKGDMFVVQHL
jgi:hypothetical protein